MLFNIDLAQLTNPCIGEIAKQSSSGEELDFIAEYAMGEGEYTDYNSKFPDESYFYMDEVIMNVNLTPETVSKLIKYNKSRDIHMTIIEERKLTDEQLDCFIKSITDLSLIEYLIEKQKPNYSKDQYDSIARNIMDGSIRIRDCYDYHYSDEAIRVDEEIQRVAARCTQPVGNALLGWWSINKKANFGYEIVFDVFHIEGQAVDEAVSTMDMSSDEADHIAKSIICNWVELQNCTDRDNGDERDLSDVYYAIAMKCSIDMRVNLMIWRADYKKKLSMQNRKNN